MDYTQHEEFILIFYSFLRFILLYDFTFYNFSHHNSKRCIIKKKFTNTLINITETKQFYFLYAVPPESILLQ